MTARRLVRATAGGNSREGAWRCVKGHDRCATSYAGPDCPYCERIPIKQLIAKRPAPRSKYGNHRCEIEVDGKLEKFDSKAERDRYLMLRIMERAGAIKDLERQPRFRLEVDDVLIGYYVGDYGYLERRSKPIDGVAYTRVCEDKKGVRTALFKWKAKHFRAQYQNIELRLT